MGGLFGIGGKKTKKDEVKPSTDADVGARKSRKVISAGGTKTKPAAVPAAPSALTATVAKPTAPASPAQKATAEQPTTLRATAAPSADMASSSPVKSGPIRADSAAAPAFGGTITSGLRRGPTRSGDAALVEFLTTSKPHSEGSDDGTPLLNAEQVEQVKSLASAEGIALDEAAVRLGFFTEMQLVAKLTQACWVPHLKLEKYEIRKKALETVSREDAIHFGVFPVDKLGSLLTLAMVNPLDQEALRTLEHKTGLDIKKVVATRSEILAAVEKYFVVGYVAKDATRSFVQDAAPRSVTQMMSQVAPAPASAPLPAVASHEPVEAISADIQDIDDLLAAEIAPSTIAPISIAPVAIDETEESATVGTEMSLELPELTIAKPAQAAADEATNVAPLAVSEPDPVALPQLELEADPQAPADAPMRRPSRDQREPTLTATPALPSIEPALVPNRPHQDPPALDRVVGPNTATPVAPAPVAPAPMAPAPVAPAQSKPTPPAPLAAAPQVSLPELPAKKPAPASRPNATDTPQRAPAGRTAPSSSATSTFKASHGGSSGLSELVPITEDEFKYAITHGRSNLFERWVTLQSRNRVINGVMLSKEIESILAPLFTSR